VTEQFKLGCHHHTSSLRPAWFIGGRRESLKQTPRETPFYTEFDIVLRTRAERCPQNEQAVAIEALNRDRI